MTGAKQGRRVAQAAREARAALRASPLGRKLKGVAAWVERKRKCLKDPVDVANGVMLFGQVDVELPGPIPFAWERKWYSNSEYAGPLGSGWHHAYDAALLTNVEEVAVRLGDGRLALFKQPTTDTGYRVFNRLERLELTLDAEGNYRVFSLDERRTYCFAPLATDLETCRLRRIEDANGFAIALTYDAQGQLRTLTDSAGRQVRLKLDAHSRIIALEAPRPDGPDYFTAVSYQYDEAGNLTAVTDALGYTVRYAYQGHLLIQKTSASGVSFYFEYDGSGPAARCVHTWGDGGLLNGRFTYEPGRTTITSTTLGDTSLYEHTDGLVTRHTDPLGAVCEWTYNVNGDLVLERDPLGRATSYAYDTRGNQTQITSSDKRKESTQYNSQDLPVQVTAGDGSRWQWTYDEAGNLLER
ncbi:MAG: RHS repeat protein, partial [Hymenobacter sp.]